MKAGWAIKPLCEVCTLQRGLTYAKTDEVEESNNIVLRATNIDRKRPTAPPTNPLKPLRPCCIFKGAGNDEARKGGSLARAS